VKSKRASITADSQPFLDGRVTLRAGDCLTVLTSLPDASVDSVVTDPPYHLTSIVKRFGAENAAPAKAGKTGAYARASAGFMGRTWDAPDAPAIDPAFAGWLAGFIDGEGCFSVHKKKVNGCETYDCQFSITLRADDKPIVDEMQRQLGGIGSVALRPAAKNGNGKPQVRYCVSSQRDCQRLREVLLAFPLRAKKLRDFEIWCHALDAWIAHDPGSSWEDVAYFRDKLMAVRQYGAAYHPSQVFFYRWAREVLRVLKPGGHLVAFSGTRTYHRMACAIEDAGFEIRDQIGWAYGSGFPKSHNQGDGWGTALKPAWEPICLARKPLIGTVAENVRQHGAGALNIDGCRIHTSDDLNGGGYNGALRHDGTESWRYRNGGAGAFVQPKGRWPANLVHDGSEEVLEAFPEAPGQQRAVTGEERSHRTVHAYGDFGSSRNGAEPRLDEGSAARFFYTAKADDEDRLGSKHPTVKPVDLMQWLVRLVTPRGGLVLDPFAGTGTTGEAAWREGMHAVLIEREAEYIADITRRMDLADKPSKRFAVAKTKNNLTDASELPLFASEAAE
jgi:DNA modification methylase